MWIQSSKLRAFRDKVAIVTGGGSGLGRAICEQLAAAGAVTIVSDLNGEAASRVAKEIKAAGGRSTAAEVDVSTPQSVIELVDRVVKTHGQLDYMFNNAGILVLSEVRDMSIEHWHHILGVNFLGVVYGTTTAYSHMIEQGSGHIVNIASLAGLVHAPTYAAYSATKYAVVGFSKSLRPEAAKLGIKVTVVCPGLINTGIGAAAIINASRELLERRGQKLYGMQPAKAARILLRGVERNSGVIVFPFIARLLWWAYRIQPNLLAPLESRLLDRLRIAREPQ